MKEYMKDLSKLTEEEYSLILKSGMMWEIFPEATGVYKQDCQKAINDEIGRGMENDIEK
jgi:hypothetical protein